MRSTIIVYARGAGYVADVAGEHGGGPRGLRIGLTAQDAAIYTSRLMLQYAANNPEGGELVAPDEIRDLVPEHLRSIEGPQ